MQKLLRNLSVLWNVLCYPSIARRHYHATGNVFKSVTQEEFDARIGFLAGYVGGYALLILAMIFGATGRLSGNAFLIGSGYVAGLSYLALGIYVFHLVVEAKDREHKVGKHAHP